MTKEKRTRILVRIAHVLVFTVIAVLVIGIGGLVWLVATQPPETSEQKTRSFILGDSCPQVSIAISFQNRITLAKERGLPIADLEKYFVELEEFYRKWCRSKP